MDMVPWETISHCMSQNCVVMIYQRIEFSEQQLMLWIFFHFCSYHGFGVQCFVGNFFVACSHCFISTKCIEFFVFPLNCMIRELLCDKYLHTE